MNRRVSIVVPVLNEGAVIEELLLALQSLRGLGHELIVSDGGSRDDTLVRAAPLADKVLSGPPGRAVQMNLGASFATHAVLWFVHADTGFQDPPGKILSSILEGSMHWGFCEVRLRAGHPAYRVIEWMMNRRSRFSRVATGDQGLFVTSALFRRVGGYPAIPLMEDIALSKALRNFSRPRVIGGRLSTSARRWQRHGIMRTVLLMWRLRLAFFFGASPWRLARQYRLCSSPTRES